MNRLKLSFRLLTIKLRDLAQRTPPNWVLAMGIIIAIIALLVIPPPFSTILFIGMVVMGVIFGTVVVNQRNNERDTSANLPHGRLRQTILLISPRLVAFGAVILMTLSAVWFAPIVDNIDPFHPRLVKAFFSLILGGWVLGLAITITRNGEARPYRLPLANLERPRFTSSARPNGWMVLLGGVILWLVAESNARVFNLRPLESVSAHWQFIGLMVGVILVARGMIGRHTWNWSQFNPSLAKIRIHRYELWLMLGITLLALGVRVWQLNDTARVMVDELNFASHIVWFWEEPNTELLNPMSGIVPFTRLFSYWASWFTEIFGRNLFGFRLLSALMGTGTVVAVWWLARHIFDRKTALLAAFILATLPPHLHFSRLALNNIGDPLFATIAFGFLARGFQTHQRRDFAIAGVALGFVPYMYEAGRLSFPLLALGFIIFILIVGFRLKINAVLRQNLLVFFIVTVLTALPVYYTLSASSAELTGRLSISARNSSYWDALLAGENPDGGWETVAENVAWSFLFYVNKPEDFIHYGGHNGLILTAIVPFLFLGIWQAIWRIFRRDAGSALLVAWIVWTGFGNSILTSNFVSTRYVLVFPALAILIAVGLRYTLPLLVRPSPRLMNMMLATFGFLIVFLNGVYYFDVHLPVFEREYRALRPYHDIEDAILRSRQFRAGTEVYIVDHTLISERDNRDLMNFFVDGITTYSYMGEDFTAEVVADMRRQVDNAIYLPHGDESLLALVTAEYGELDPQYSDNPYVDFTEELVLYYLPAVNYIQPSGVVLDRPARHRNELRWLALSAVIVGAIGIGTWRYRDRVESFGERVTHVGRAYLLQWRDTLIGLGENILDLFNRITEPLAELTSPLRTLSIPITRGLTLCAIGVLTFAMFIFLTTTQVEAGIGVSMVGAVLIGIASYAHQARTHYTLPRPTPEAIPSLRPATWRTWLLGIGGFCLIVLTFANGQGASFPVWLQIILWTIGVSGVTLGLIGKRVGVMKLGSDSPPRPKIDMLGVHASTPLQSAKPDALKHSPSLLGRGGWGVRVLPLCLILCLALVLRVHNLEYETHRFVDELHSAQAVADLMENPNTALLSQHGEVTAFTWFYPVLQRLGVSVYGASLTGLRVVSALMGVLTVWAVWWLARTLFDDKTAFLTALILAVFPPHVHFSRLGINNIIDPLMGILALTLLVRGLRSGRRTPFVLAGLALGMTTYFYEGGRLLFPPLILGFTALLITHHWRRNQPIAWRGLLLTGMMFALVSIPVYFAWSANDLPIFPRFDSEYISLGGQDDYTGNLLNAIHLLVGLPDTGWFYGGEVGLILGVFVPLFLLGIAHAFRRFTEPRMGLLLLWLGAAIIGNSLLANSSDASRYVVLFPAIALLMAIGLVETLRLFANPISYSTSAPVDDGDIQFNKSPALSLMSGRAGVGLVFVILCALIITGVNIWYYFAEHIPDHTKQFPTAIIHDDVLFRLKSLPSDTNAFVISNRFLRHDDLNTMLAFYGRDDDLTAQIVSVEAFNDQFIEDHFVQGGRYAVFVIDSRHPEVITTLSRHFGVGLPHQSPYDLPDNEDAFSLYFFSILR